MESIVWKDLLAWLQFALSIALGLFLWITNKDKVTNKRISDFEDHNDKRFDRQAERLTKVETTLDNRPKSPDINRLHRRMDDVQKQVSSQSGELKGIHKTLDLIHKTLMENKK